MNSPLLPAAAAALCAAVLLVLLRHFIRTPLPPPTEEKQPQEKLAPILTPPPTPGSDVEKGETPPPTSYFSDIKIRSELVEEVWPPVERETEEPAPTLGTLPDVALVWGMDYRPSVDRRPLMAYSTIASALGVEDEPVLSSPVSPVSPVSSVSSVSSASEATDTRPMRSRSLISGIVSDWNSLSQSEQQAWATLSEARASRSRGTHSGAPNLYTGRHCGCATHVNVTLCTADERNARTASYQRPYINDHRAWWNLSFHIPPKRVPPPGFETMQLFKAATPGFLFTLAATALLAVVSFSVPWFKSVYFLRAAITQSGVNGSVTFGVLGYCLDFNNQIQCSNASVGWEFNPNELLGNDLPIQIPNVVVKWLTYALVLHIVALGLSGVSAVFGLLAHVRNLTMSCFSSCIAGTAATVALIAFIFDLVLFFAVRARVNNIQGGSASIGNALWMTLAAWALLFFSGCAYAFGRCCASKSPSGGSSWRRSRKDSERTEDGGKYDRESEQMRLDAVKAEADRKARQRAGPQEVGLPAFHEYERAPLRREEPQYYEEEVEVVVPYTDRPGREPSRASQRTQRTQASGGAAAAAYRPNKNYEPGAPGTRAIDDYYNNTAPTAASLAAANTYPPQPQRRPSEQSQRQASIGQPQRRASSHSNYDPYAQTQQNVPPVPSLPQGYSSPPNRPVDPYAAAPQPQSRMDPYLAIAAATGGAAAAAGYTQNRGYSTDSYNHQQYPSSSHQQYPSASQQYTQTQGQQDPYASSSYNPNAAVMSPPQPTHYLDNSNSGYQGYG
ncbi:hypothetical protein FRC11_005416, partial [Ceratobasidium sp. 423]